MHAWENYLKRTILYEMYIKYYFSIIFSNEYMGFSLSIVFLKAINFLLFFLYVHVITMKPKFYRRLRGNIFFVILVRLFLYHGINSHLVLNPYSQLVSADKIFTHIPRAGTQWLGLNLLKSFATLKIMGYLDRISVYTY